MISELFSAAFKAGLPVGLCSYGLVWWALKKKYVLAVDSVKSLERAVKKRSKDKTLKKEGDAFHRKWLAFGGGFYGVVALLTYAIVELGEIRDFIMQLGGVVELLKSLSLNLVINLVIDAFMNFIVAIAWPAYWLGEVRGPQIWIWLIVAYGGYWLGVHLAVRRFGTVSETEN